MMLNNVDVLRLLVEDEITMEAAIERIVDEIRKIPGDKEAMFKRFKREVIKGIISGAVEI